MSSQSSVCIPTVGNAGRWLWFFSWSKIVILDYALHQNPDAELLALTTVITGIMVYVCSALRASLTTQANPSQGYRSEISGDEALELTRWFQFILIWKQPWTQNIRPPLTLYSLGMTTCWWTEGVRRLRENVVHSPPNLQELLRNSQKKFQGCLWKVLFIYLFAMILGSHTSLPFGCISKLLGNFGDTLAQVHIWYHVDPKYTLLASVSILVPHKDSRAFISYLWSSLH